MIYKQLLLCCKVMGVNRLFAESEGWCFETSELGWLHKLLIDINNKEKVKAGSQQNSLADANSGIESCYDNVVLGRVVR